MFAVIKTGGKQYKVAKNGVVKVEKLAAELGSTIIFDQVLAVTDANGNVTIGAPLVKNVVVSAEVLEHKKADKVIIFKKKRRHNYRRKKGHRQEIVVLRIQDIGEGLKAKDAPADYQPKVKAASKKQETAPKKKVTERAPEVKAAKATASKKAQKSEAAEAPKKKAPAAKKTAAKKQD